MGFQEHFLAKKELGISRDYYVLFETPFQKEFRLRDEPPFKYLIKAVGLDSSEVDIPRVNLDSLNNNERRVLDGCSCWKEVPPEYIWEADLLKVKRIDHGVRYLRMKSWFSV